MATNMVRCVKLGQELPAIDPQTTDGSQALRMCLLIGGTELQKRIREQVSAKAWSMWKDQMLMIFNEFRLDPTSDEANAVLKRYLEEFFFGKPLDIPNYVPPEKP
jgi:Fe-S cluster biosynthesis and repair protein YggX